MKNSHIIALVISGLLIALAGVVFDYQRRLKNDEIYKAWRDAEHARKEAEYRRTQADMAKVQQNLQSWSQATAETARKFADDTAKIQADARNQARIRAHGT